MALGAVADRLLLLLADGTPRSTAELADLLGVDRIGVRSVLAALRDHGRIVAVGTTVGRRRWGGRQPTIVWRLATSRQ